MGMVTTRLLELRKRRGLMLALIAVNIGIPVVFLAVRLISHAVDPKSYGPAGGYSIFTSLVTGFMYIFGFIVAAVVGCTAGSVDLTEGMFRHLVITGRSRLALYLARIPAGLAIVISMVAIGYVIVCAVCVFAAPTQLNYDGVIVPRDFPSSLGQLGRHPRRQGDLRLQLQRAGKSPQCALRPRSDQRPSVRCHHQNAERCGHRAHVHAGADQGIRRQHGQSELLGLSRHLLVPSTSLMVDVGLWIALEAAIGFTVGLGLASLMGQRTVPVILLIVLELILTPIFSRHIITHLVNLERGIVGVAMVHIEPGGLPTPFGEEDRVAEVARR